MPQIYGPVWLASTSLVTTSYNAINCDEAQDVTMLKILFMEKAAFDSDRIAHTHWPNHKTIMNFVGDDDQSINGWLGAKVNAVKGLAERYPDAVQLTMPVTLRLSKRHCEEAEKAFADLHAELNLAVRASRSAMQPAESAIVGTLEREVTLIERPVDTILLVRMSCQQWHTAMLTLSSLCLWQGKTAFFSRRVYEARKMYAILVSHAIPCRLDLTDDKVSLHPLSLTLVDFLAQKACTHTNSCAMGRSLRTCSCLKWDHAC